MMNETFSGRQVFAVWQLLSAGGSQYLNEMKPQPEVKDRKALLDAGLIQCPKCKKQTPGKRATQAILVSLTEEGWQWASENLDLPFSTKATATFTLQSLLARLKGHLSRRGISLAEFIMDGSHPADVSPSDQAANPAAGPAGQGIAARIRETYFQLSGHQPSCRVRLAELRGQLSDVSREELDAALRQMERDNALVLYPLDNPQEIRPADRAAVLENSAGFPRHIVYMER